MIREKDIARTKIDLKKRRELVTLPSTTSESDRKGPLERENHHMIKEDP